ncbi:mannose-6-phosphate isomerase [Moorena producens PAL-8-15-08-1]|uniref:Mannose-6-phosphate isomerase n=1 Tax=Moorena producens PAL-8-15-08-1 TaxID=1458985 RepID=A0A1D8U0B3_9CYAN|nr:MULTISPECIES: cupin domain-containing protein [Moorena]AOX03332.1 mannose-6-phosphate isomerase [Moorena producens PAL-8-15-08-1]NEO81082.1 cupin domain-containing protein [Moorena sp. SIO4G3]
MVQSKEISQVSAITLQSSRVAEGVAATELRPWGSFTVLEEGRGYKIKRIEVKPGHRLSLQMHYHRSEHWIVVSGTAKVICGDKEEIVHQNQSTYVPQGYAHRLENPGVIPLVLIEVQNGEYLGEDDIIRFEDDYARSKPEGK